uniref:Major facilitator superfamily (MFS) profile domain-containing protein n=1 Tax=Gossypium raimondii TaxID=29730 RepID=A0A0D2TQC6_GOSRA|nr:hypothetical protein B456_009G237600 [Gossypium raimondii]
MAVGGFGGVDGPVSSFNGKITASVVITCIVAASSGLIFGYDIGISGGVTTMQPFLQKFFPSVLRKAAEAKTNIYCVYDSQVLTSFTSSLYIAGLAASLVASRLTAAIGRRNTMVLGGLTFLAGAAINGGAANIAMLIFGRILLGFGVGFTNQATPVYLSEVAPPRWRGAFNTGFQFFIGIGVVAANCINYVLFQSVGFGNDSALIAAIILGLVNLASILVSTGVVDRFGRRFLFLEGGIQMFVCQVGVAVLLAVTTGVSGTKEISKGYAILVLVLMCIYAAGFGWSWGPLSWLIPSEIFPIKIRSTGQSISVAVNFATTFVLSQTFLTMLCHFKYGTFLFYAAWIASMTIFVALFLPETKGIPLDSMNSVWEKHWYWRRFVSG